MPNKNYEQGYRLEIDLVNKMNDEYLWPLAIRSAGSHHCVDVVGINRSGWMFLIQCKSTKKSEIGLTKLFENDRVKLLERMPGDHHKCLVIRQKYTRGMVVFRFDRDDNLWHPTNLEWLFIYN